MSQSNQPPVTLGAVRTFRLHVGVFGRRNAGKSSLVNALAGQAVSIVSPVPGTTADPVEKAIELRPGGPATLIDTAGLDDDAGALGARRAERALAALGRCDVALVVSGDGAWTEWERRVVAECRSRGIGVVAVRAQCDGPGGDALAPEWPEDLGAVRVSAETGAGLDALVGAIVGAAPDDFVNRSAIVADLVPAGGVVLLVVPVDKEAPAGRLILPQVQTIRDLLDGHAMALVVQDAGLAGALAALREPPDLVVTDSQAFGRVASVVPPEVPLTSFSVLFARFQGDLAAFAAGARALGSLQPGDRVVIAEACTHRPVEEDIGTVKIPALLRRRAGGDLDFAFVRGHDLPSDIGRAKVVIHCGACMWNRRAMLRRIADCHAAGVPITNYGMTIAWCLGILDRALRPLLGR